MRMSDSASCCKIRSKSRRRDPERTSELDEMSQSKSRGAARQLMAFKLTRTWRLVIGHQMAIDEMNQKMGFGKI